jgi:hypothetical protein
MPKEAVQVTARLRVQRRRRDEPAVLQRPGQRQPRNDRRGWWNAVAESGTGYLLNASYTFSRSIDRFSDEGLYQVQNDQTHPELNRGLSDFHRAHRLIVSWTWAPPFHGNPWVEGWQLSGIGTLQSGRPFTVVDEDGSAILSASTAPRPNPAPGATLEDQTTPRCPISRCRTRRRHHGG